MQQPLVSILINNYNYGRYLESCVQSCLDQTYPNIEIIVYDDASTDNSLQVLEHFGDSIKLITNSQSKYDSNAFNQSRAINEAFAVANGEIVCLLDSDDLFKKNKVARIVAAFTPEAVLVQHPFEEVDESGIATGVIRPMLKRAELPEYIFKSNNLFHLFTQTSGLSFSRDYLTKMLPIVPDNYEKVWADVRLSRSAIFHGQVVTIHEPLASYRKHGANDSDKTFDPKYREQLVEQVYAVFNEKCKEFKRPGIQYKKSTDSVVRANILSLFWVLFKSNDHLKYRVRLALGITKRMILGR